MQGKLIGKGSEGGKQIHKNVLQPVPQNSGESTIKKILIHSWPVKIARCGEPCSAFIKMNSLTIYMDRACISASETNDNYECQPSRTCGYQQLSPFLSHQQLGKCWFPNHWKRQQVGKDFTGKQGKEQQIGGSQWRWNSGKCFQERGRKRG